MSTRIIMHPENLEWYFTCNLAELVRKCFKYLKCLIENHVHISITYLLTIFFDIFEYSQKEKH